MDGKYLGSNLTPLKAIGNEKALNTINAWLAKEVEDAPERTIELVAYSLKNSEGSFVTINCLFERRRERFSGLYLRSWEYFKRTENTNDRLKEIAEYGIGVSEFEIETFLNLRDFYKKSKEVSA